MLGVLVLRVVLLLVLLRVVVVGRIKRECGVDRDVGRRGRLHGLGYVLFVMKKLDVLLVV